MVNVVDSFPLIGRGFYAEVSLDHRLVAVWIVGRFAQGQTNEAYRAPADRAADILHIRLDLDVSLKEQTIRGTATLDFEPIRPLSSLALDAVDFKISQVRDVSPKGEPGKNLDFENTGKQLVIRFAEPQKPGERRRIEIAYEAKHPQSGLHFFRPTEAEPDIPWMVWSQGEAEDNRYWFPCFDRPNERQTTELIARVDKDFTVLSNGRLVEKRPIEDGRIEFHWKQDKPHVSYLVTLVAGKFAIVEENWRGRPITYYVSPDREQDAKQTFRHTPEMLDFFSEKFGIEYPWEKYAQVVVEQFTAGGMENTSATTLHDGVMHDARALIDSSPDGLISHELGHQWWGDLVTCRDWSHLWLNEGFATYCEVLWCEHKLGRDERDYLLYQKSQSARSGTAKERPIVDRRYPGPDTMFDVRAYPKGGWVLHMLRSRLGDADFFRGLKRYGLEYAYRTAETSDLRKSFERLYGVSLERFFHDWTERKGHPELNIKTTHQPEDGFVKIEIRQTQKDEAFHFPLTIELTKAGAGGEPVTITPFIKEKEQTFLLPVKSRPALVRIDPEFTLLADIEEDKSHAWWVAQLTEGPTVAERLRAVEHFAKNQSAANRELLRACLKQDGFYGVRKAAASALGKSHHADSRDALAAGLKESHPKVRRDCAAALGAYEDDAELAQLLKAKHEAGDESYFVEAAVVQALAKITETPDRKLFEAALEKESHRDVIRTEALQGLSRCADAGALKVLETWTKRGHSRTARLAAINALAQSLKKHDFSKEAQTDAVELLASYLKEPGPRVRRAAMAALVEVPHLAQKEKERIATMADHDADARVRTAAARAIKKFDEKKSSPEQLQKLQSELDKLKEQYQKLEKQIEKLQKK